VFGQMQVEQRVDVDLDGEDPTRTDELGTHPLDAVDEGSVSLGYDAGLGAAEVSTP
jgi:hypothetical protein